MIRRLAGTFDPHGRTSRSPAQSALATESGEVAVAGPLTVAYTGPAPRGGRVLCLLDGYIDNCVELCKQLGLSAGEDEDRLLQTAWLRWGDRMIARLRGEFVLLLWDSEHEQGLLARDQLGVQPLLLNDAGDGSVRFASETCDLLSLLPARPQPDRVTVAHWLAMSVRPGHATMFEGIRRLAGGTMLRFDRDGYSERRYWTPRFDEPLALGDAELAEVTRGALDVAVRRRIAPEGETAVMMSGGLDSSAVAAIASRVAPGQVRALSAVFPEHPRVDEQPLIEELRAMANLPSVTAEVRTGGILASAVEATAASELPLRSWGDFWALPLLRAAARGGASVVLGGDGGDELFGVRSYLLADLLRSAHPILALRLAHELPGAGDTPPRRELAAILAEVAVGGAFPPAIHSSLLRIVGHIAPHRGWMLKRTMRDLRSSDDATAWKRLDGPRWWARTAHDLTAGVEGTGVFEHHRQRAALAGIEARHPLFDLDLFELALRQPPRASFDRHRNRPVLRAAMAGILPESIRMRRAKAQFDELIMASIEQDGPMIRRLLSDPAGALREYVNPDAVMRTLFESSQLRRSQPFSWMWQVWRLATAECWLRAQQGRPITLADLCPARVSLKAVAAPIT